jgi:hypothetical protein
MKKKQRLGYSQDSPKQMNQLGYVSSSGSNFKPIRPHGSRKHVRVTAWKTPSQGCRDWVMGDGLTLQSAWNALLYHAQHGNLEFAGGKKPRKAGKR